MPNCPCVTIELGALHMFWSVQCDSKKSPLRFSGIFPKRLGIFNQFLNTYCMTISTLDYKFLFKYLKLWQSYAILSAIT